MALRAAEVLLPSMLHGRTKREERKEESWYLLGLLAPRLSRDDGLAVLVQLDLGDDDVGRVDGELDCRAVRLVTGDAFHVDDPLLSVHLHNLALLPLAAAADDSHLVVLADRKSADLVTTRRSVSDRVQRQTEA